MTTTYEEWKARNAAGNLPRTYVQVDPVTGDVVARPELCRDGAAAEELAARMRSARAADSPVGYQVQQHQTTGSDDALVWPPPERRPLYSGTPEGDLVTLWARRAGRNRTRIPGGLEFDAYGPGCAPCPELQSARVRVTFQDAVGVLVGGDLR